MIISLNLKKKVFLFARFYIVTNFFKKIYRSIRTFKNKLLNKSFNYIIGIDLGTANTLICTKDQGIILNEASVVSYISENGVNSGFLYGNEAKKMIGKVPFKIETEYPIDDGVISRNTLSEDMIRKFLFDTVGNRSIFAPTAVVGVPFSATEAERKTLQEVIERCNVKNVYMIYESIASAIGAGVQVDKPNGVVVIDIGGGTTEISAISLGGIVKNKTFKYGGRKIDKSIVDYLCHKYQLLIGENVAENIKKQIGIAYLRPDEKAKKIVVYGRNIETKNPQEIKISQQDIVVAIASFTNLLIENLEYVLESVPAELMQDIIHNGIILCGGGAGIANLDYVIKQTTGLKSIVPVNPELCLINGLRKIVGDIAKYKHLLFNEF